MLFFFLSFDSRLKIVGQKAFRRRSGSETCSWWSWFSTVDFICVLIIFGGLKLMLQPRLSFSIQFCRVICLFLWNQCQVLCFFFPQKKFFTSFDIFSLFWKKQTLDASGQKGNKVFVTSGGIQIRSDNTFKSRHCVVEISKDGSSAETRNNFGHAKKKKKPSMKIPDPAQALRNQMWKECRNSLR